MEKFTPLQFYGKSAASELKATNSGPAHDPRLSLQALIFAHVTSSPNSPVIRTAADGGSGTGVKMQWPLTQNAFRLHGIAARLSCLSDAGAWSPFRLSCKRHCAD
jgi:hypothetical protein